MILAAFLNIVALSSSKLFAPVLFKFIISSYVSSSLKFKSYILGGFDFGTYSSSNMSTSLYTDTKWSRMMLAAIISS